MLRSKRRPRSGSALRQIGWSTPTAPLAFAGLDRASELDQGSRPTSQRAWATGSLNQRPRPTDCVRSCRGIHRPRSRNMSFASSARPHWRARPPRHGCQLDPASRRFRRQEAQLPIERDVSRNVSPTRQIWSQRNWPNCQGRSKTGPLLPVEKWATRFMSRSRSGWH